MKLRNELNFFEKNFTEISFLVMDDIRFLSTEQNTKFKSMKRTDDAITLWVFFFFISQSVFYDDIKTNWYFFVQNCNY